MREHSKRTPLIKHDTSIRVRTRIGIKNGERKLRKNEGFGRRKRGRERKAAGMRPKRNGGFERRRNDNVEKMRRKRSEELGIPILTCLRQCDGNYPVRCTITPDPITEKKRNGANERRGTGGLKRKRNAEFERRKRERTKTRSVRKRAAMKRPRRNAGSGRTKRDVNERSK